MEEFEPTFSFASEKANECKWNRITKLATGVQLTWRPPFVTYPLPIFAGAGKVKTLALQLIFMKNENWRPFQFFAPSKAKKLHYVSVASASRQSGLSHFRTETHFHLGRKMTKLIHSIMVKNLGHFAILVIFINYLVIFRTLRAVTRTLTTFTT